LISLLVFVGILLTNFFKKSEIDRSKDTIIGSNKSPKLNKDDYIINKEEINRVEIVINSLYAYPMASPGHNEHINIYLNNGKRIRIIPHNIQKISELINIFKKLQKKIIIKNPRKNKLIALLYWRAPR